MEKSLLDLLRHLDYGRYEVYLLLLEDLGDYIPDIPSEVNLVFKDLTNTYGSVSSSLMRCFSMRDWLGFRMRLIFLLCKFFGPKSLRMARGLLLRRMNYDCAIGYRHGVCSDLVAYAVKAKRKLTWWHHGEWNMDADELADYERSCALFDRVVTVSDGCASMLVCSVPSIETRMAVIPNMLDVQDIRSKAAAFNPYERQQLRFVTVGRLSPEKYVENAVYAAECLIQRGVKNFSWHIIGEGPERKKIEALIHEKHLEEFFSMEGSQSNPYPYIKQADLYVHTSYVESQGLTVLEAMALGVPCVVTRSLGPEGYIRDGENGILVEQNVESLVAAIMKVIQSPQICDTLRKNTSCPAEFLRENILKKIKKIIA